MADRKAKPLEGRFLGRVSLWLCLVMILPLAISAGLAAEAACPPTRADFEGPFYKPGAPMRPITGRGLLVRGTVKAAGNCQPIPGARIEWWQANSQGDYDDLHRGAMVADQQGRYNLETDFPGKYPGRPPHIHVKVFATGYRSLTTQLYIERGQTDVTFNLVLARE